MHTCIGDTEQSLVIDFSSHHIVFEVSGGYLADWRATVLIPLILTSYEVVCVLQA